MFRTIRNFLALFLLAAATMGFTQLNDQNSIISEAMLYCCNNGFCHDISCSSSSSISTVRNGCNDESADFTCMDCMDLIRAGQVCGVSTTANTWCKIGTQRYYGEGVDNSYTITFSASQGVSTSYYVDGTWYSTASFTWYIYSTHYIMVNQTIPVNSKYQWVFSQWSDGNTSCERDYAVSSNANLYAIYNFMPITKPEI